MAKGDRRSCLDPTNQEMDLCSWWATPALIVSWSQLYVLIPEICCFLLSLVSVNMKSGRIINVEPVDIPETFYYSSVLQPIPGRSRNFLSVSMMAALMSTNYYKSGLYSPSIVVSCGEGASRRPASKRPRL
jgi:hypothetical protein